MAKDIYQGSDVLTIDDRLITDQLTGKVVEVRYPNNIANIDTGKDGNSVITKIANGQNAEATVRVMVGGETDQYLSLRLSQFKEDPASFVSLKAKFTKRTGDGQGNITKTTWDLTGGAIMKLVEGEEDTTGDVEQTVAVYNLKFSNGTRTIK